MNSYGNLALAEFLEDARKLECRCGEFRGIIIQPNGAGRVFYARRTLHFVVKAPQTLCEPAVCPPTPAGVVKS